MNAAAHECKVGIALCCVEPNREHEIEVIHQIKCTRDTFHLKGCAVSTCPWGWKGTEGGHFGCCWTSHLLYTMLKPQPPS